MAIDRQAGMVSRDRHWWRLMASAILAFGIGSTALAAQDTGPVTAKGDSVSIKLVDVDLRAAVQALSRYLEKPVVFGGVGGNRVTIETPHAVSPTEVPRLLRGVLESQNYELFDDTTAGLYRVRQREAARPLMPTANATPSEPQGTVQLFAIHLRHARAEDVAATVNALYGRGSALGESGGRRPTLSRQLEDNRVPPATTGNPPEAVAGIGGRSASFAGEVTIVPDPRANSLLVRANQHDFELVNAAVKELDIRPLQVLISVTIAEVRKDRSLSFGVGAKAPQSRIRRHDDATASGSTTGSTASDLIVDILKLGPHDVDLTLSAAAARGDVSILSRPVVIAANNEEAELNVGSQRPFVQVSRVLPTDNTARDQVVQYKDVGTKLTVRPTISPDGYVMLQVTQEVNQATNEASGLAGVDAPVISTRSVQTQLLIKDRQTVILGGLRDSQKDHSQGGVPVLSSIPWLGGLFGRVSRTATETELYLFITPQVIRDDAEAEEVTKPARARAGGTAP
ncbi:MAG: type II secretion system protein GspD [Gemmatimonadaceae bacterium]